MGDNEKEISNPKFDSVGLIIAVIVAVIYNANYDGLIFLFKYIGDVFGVFVVFFTIGIPGLISFIFYYAKSRNVEDSFYVGLASSITYSVISALSGSWVLP